MDVGNLFESIGPAAAIIAAVVAGVFAFRTRRHETQASRIRDLENRNAQRKHETYEPIISAFGDILDPAKKDQRDAILAKATPLITKFNTWISIYGSDEAVTAWHNYRQAAFSGVPTALTLRFYADFVLAARRDLGSPDSEVTRTQILGMRVNDLYTSDSDLRSTLEDEPLSEVAARHSWTVPWVPPPPIDRIDPPG